MKFSHCLLSLLALAATACSSPYTVTLNERVVYDPSGRPGNNLLADPNLQGCLNQIMNSGGLEDPSDVTLMACPDAGVRDLTGIGNLPNLEQLELSGNGIDELGPLAGLENLRVLNLQNNDVRSVTPLMNLPLLRFVSLQGNERIPCRQLDNLRDKVGPSLGRPADCRR